jgi:hypothetical protein
LQRRELEACDAAGGICVCQSAAGGTGSGLGTRLVECLRDEFSDETVMNALVCPYRAGEVVVKDYNACLTIAHLLLASDMILMLENQTIDRLAKQVMSMAQPTFADLNAVIGLHVGAALVPSSARVEGSSGNGIHGLVTHLCSHSVGDRRLGAVIGLDGRICLPELQADLEFHGPPNAATVRGLQLGHVGRPYQTTFPSATRSLSTVAPRDCVFADATIRRFHRDGY